jgi:hypothetical protein
MGVQPGKRQTKREGGEAMTKAMPAAESQSPRAGRSKEVPRCRRCIVKRAAAPARPAVVSSGCAHLYYGPCSPRLPPTFMVVPSLRSPSSQALNSSVKRCAPADDQATLKPGGRWAQMFDSACRGPACVSVARRHGQGGACAMCLVEHIIPPRRLDALLAAPPWRLPQNRDGHSRAAAVTHLPGPATGKGLHSPPPRARAARSHPSAPRRWQRRRSSRSLPPRVRCGSQRRPQAPLPPGAA